MFEPLIYFIALFLILLGSLNCFFGYRIFIFFLQVLGFIFGVILGEILGLLIFSDELIAFITALVGGIAMINAVKTLYEYLVYINGFILGAIIGLIIIFLNGIEDIGISTVLIIICGIIGGILAKIIEKLSIIVSTSFSGAWLIVTGFSLFWDVKWELDTIILSLIIVNIKKIVLWVLLGITGIIIQYRFTQYLEAQHLVGRFTIISSILEKISTHKKPSNHRTFRIGIIVFGIIIIIGGTWNFLIPPQDENIYLEDAVWHEGSGSYNVKLTPFKEYIIIVDSSVTETAYKGSETTSCHDIDSHVVLDGTELECWPYSDSQYGHLMNIHDGSFTFEMKGGGAYIIEAPGVSTLDLIFGLLVDGIGLYIIYFGITKFHTSITIEDITNKISMFSINEISSQSQLSSPDINAPKTDSNLQFPEDDQSPDESQYYLSEIIVCKYCQQSNLSSFNYCCNCNKVLIK